MKLTTKEVALFGMFGVIMFISDMVMDFLPNIHLLGMFIVSFTVVYRKKALIPIYVYVFLNGLYAGFSTWWVPYLYIWTVLWGFTMLLPKNLPPKAAPIIYMLVSAAHGFLFGTLYAPAQALFFELNFEQTKAWIIAGLSFDIIHGVSNFFCGILIVPMVKILRNSEKFVK